MPLPNASSFLISRTLVFSFSPLSRDEARSVSFLVARQGLSFCASLWFFLPDYFFFFPRKSTRFPFSLPRLLKSRGPDSAPQDGPK